MTEAIAAGDDLPKKIPIILDTDIGSDIDDMYALALALRHPQLDLKGVTTVYGDVQARARLTAKALRLAGREDIPVCAGIRASAERKKRGEIDDDFSGALTYTQFVTAADPEFGKRYPDAIEFLLKALNNAPEPIGLVGIGACSNLAAVIRHADNQLKRKIRFIALMGGETSRMQAEYNVACDPEAADVVLTCGLPRFMGTFMVTKQVALSAAEVEEYLGGATDPLLRALYETSKMWLPRHTFLAGPVLYDVTPLFWAADPKLIRTSEIKLRVETQGQFTRGYTVPVAASESAPVTVSVSLDAAQLKSMLLNIIGAGQSEGQGK